MPFSKLWIIIVVLLFSCKTKYADESFDNADGYNLSNPVMVHLSTELDEISGIQYYPKDSSIFAIQDELGVLYKVNLKDKIRIFQWKFSGNTDYEDVVLKDDVFYVLQSSGNITACEFPSKDSLISENYTAPFAGANNFETLYYDPTLDKLVLVCKNCASDNKAGASAFTFDPRERTYSTTPVYRISVDEVARELNKESVKFKPSAAAIHPITKDLYILSAVEKVLVIADPAGKVKQAVALNPRFFKQPEGISFAPDGTMFISNEFAEVGAPNILIFTYKRSDE